MYTFATIYKSVINMSLLQCNCIELSVVRLKTLTGVTAAQSKQLMWWRQACSVCTQHAPLADFHLGVRDTVSSTIHSLIVIHITQSNSIRESPRTLR